MSAMGCAEGTTIGEVARLGSVLAVVAQPDDESFGRGALLAELARSGAGVRVLCLTHGEASTLGGGRGLAQRRARELACACAHLGISAWKLEDFPDGRLGAIAPDVLDAVVEGELGDAVTLVAFEPGGVTGHLDHQAATAVAERVAARHGLTVVHWGVAPGVAACLNREFGTHFVALEGADVVETAVDRSAQRSAMACHASQLCDNPVVLRRFELEGDLQRFCVRPPVVGGRGS